MDLAEAHDLLTIAAAYDNREPSAAADQAWAAALSHLAVDFDDARQAIIEHYAESTEWIKPAHVGARAQTIRADRYREERRQAKERERAELEAAGYGPNPENSPPLRDRREDIHRLIEGFRMAPDGTERWP